MEAIFGVLYRNNKSFAPIALKKMQAAITHVDKIGCYIWKENDIGLGQTLRSTSTRPQNKCNSHLPTQNNLVFTAAGRLDNPAELCDLLKIPESERLTVSDYELLRYAYVMWGVDCSSRIYGDWVFSAWHSSDRRLVLSRSHHGNIPLFYIDLKNFAFASSRNVLLASQITPIELDELWLAQCLTSWPAYCGDRTPHKQVKCLPPGHYLVATENNCQTYRYWFPEDKTEIHLSRKEEYAEGLRSVFDEAVKCRLRSDTKIGTTLSGGLDSGSVAATAALLLADKGQRLDAFTSVPLFNTQPYVAARFGDELPLAKATAVFAGNIDFHPLTAADVSPIMAIRRAIQLSCVPMHGPANLFWSLDLLQSARASGCSVLLSGMTGNPGISWTGDIFSQPLSFLLSHINKRILAKTLINRMKQTIKSSFPIQWITACQQRYLKPDEWYRRSAIHPDLARRLHLFEQRLLDPDTRPTLNSREQRTRILMPGRSINGAYETELGSPYGLEIRDPTADARVIDFTFSVPDSIFMDPKTGIDRWLIREAMKGRLPEEVRLNRNRGRQAGDIVPRLRACAAEVETALAELAHGPAAEYVDLNHMYQAWQVTQRENTNEAFVVSKQIVLRGIMIGLFVNDFHKQHLY